jgi:putative DNA primase/helicase
VKVVELPNLPEGGDVSDWLDAEGTAEELERLAREAPEWEPTPEAEPELVGRLLVDVEPERVSWLWPGWIPLGKLTLIDGDPGTGKSALTTDLAARMSAGRALPDGTPCEAGGVVLLNAEDGVADTIRPRLDAAEGKPDKVLDLATVGEGGDQRLLSVPADLEIIERGI